MVLPGLLTSALGLLLMVPAVRGFLMRRMGRGVAVRTRFRGDVPPGAFRRGDGVIDGEYSVQDDPPAPVREGLTDRSGRGKSGWTQH